MGELTNIVLALTTALTISCASCLPGQHQVYLLGECERVECSSNAGCFREEPFCLQGVCQECRTDYDCSFGECYFGRCQ